ncbi:O-fucosyltransferase 7-like isoform X1 [Papaver somniferum]|uniref:O-fucosyltransferase 7-like isoform X1 n=1 Tax=Papaver somniferum TaxID=3469 RepID=UPI000E6F481B|nr:O-fucosyltransferase 7-like isoform X1 [Papaver somniferum]
MLKRKNNRSISLIRTVISCTIFVISIATLLSVHLHIFLYSKVPVFSDPTAYKLPSQHEIGHHGSELSWTQELTPPQFSKLPPPSQKLNAANRNRDIDKLWKAPQNKDFVPCVDPSPEYSLPTESRGYLLVHTNGGLNQMRAGICDMVAVARIINATLVVPELDKRSFWQDTSNFSDVFDLNHFISALANDVKIIKKLPKELATATRAVKHFRSWSGIEYYQDEIARMWEDYQIIRAAKSDSRLANNNLPPDIQKLRCRTLYGALRFSPRIEAMGKLLVERMRSYGPYIALHLRYEKDMLAFSGCTHGLSADEADELTLIRENTPHWKVKDIDSREQRSKGYCPLTPKEVGMFLTGLGYPSNTPIYIAAGEIYGGDNHMAHLLSRFPLIMSKEKIASVEELEPFISHASQMAALDYIVSVESDVFIPSYSGNMARAVEGHRRFLGHRKTFSPDRKALVHLFDRVERGSLKEGKKLSDQIVEIHRRRQGSPRKRKGPISGTRGMERFRSEEAFYVNPLPDCLCQMDPANINNSYTSSNR